ncbi:MAG: M24 family metallopeptidase [Candidatus Bathyarchaeia archaeon]
MDLKMEYSPKYAGEVVAGIVDEFKPKVDVSIQIDKREYRERWRKVQEAMDAKGYDSIYVCGSELDRSDVAWLAGVFDPIIERYGALLPRDGPPIVLAGPEGGHVIEEAAEKSGAEVVFLRDFQISDEEYRWARFLSLDGLLERLGLGKGKRMAICSSGEFIPYDHVAMLQGRLGSDNVVFDPLLLRLIKYEKSEKELMIMQQANRVADAALRGMLAVLLPGATELQVAAVGDYIVKALGGGRTGFPTIVTSGERGYTVIGPATNRVIRMGDVVSLGVSPTFNGYHGVVRRTVKVGEGFTSEEKEFIGAVEGLYKVVMDATLKAASEDLPSNYIDREGKEYLNKLKLRTLKGDWSTPWEPYTFIHNMGCSECQEGYGAVTPYTSKPLGNRVGLAVDVALTGFQSRGEQVFPILYAVIEDAFWKDGSRVGVYNELPLLAQHLVGNLQPVAGGDVNPYHAPYGSQ